jgi:hypothetical protein
MLCSAQRLIVPQAGLLQQACFYSSKVDYNELVFKGTSDIAKVDKVPDKEIGMCAGVPLETYKRKVGGILVTAAAVAPAAAQQCSSVAGTKHRWVRHSICCYFLQAPACRRCAELWPSVMLLKQLQLRSHDLCVACATAHASTVLSTKAQQ